MTRSLLPVMSLLSVPAVMSSELFVAPGGDDAGPGSAARPFATLARAQQVVRAQVRTGLEQDVTVKIGPGVYELTAPLRFGPGDAGTDEHAVTYAAAGDGEVVISGGVRVTGWQRGDGKLWTTSVRGVGVGWYPRQLFVNGLRAVRARTPNADGSPAYGLAKGAALSEDRSTYTVTLDPAEVQAWGGVEDVELVVCGNWEITRKRLSSVDPDTGVLTLAPPHGGGHQAIRPAKGRHYFLENAPELLDQPGEWYLDRPTGALTYWPREGEDMSQAVTVMPRLTRLVEVVGSAEKPVRNLHFRGLRFAHADWAFPECGFNGIQASHYCYPKEGQKGWTWFPWLCSEPALLWRYAHGCSLTDGALELLGGVGLHLLQGCCDNRIEGNAVRDIGGSGIMVGEHLSGFPWSKETLPDAQLPKRNRVANNLVRRCGLDDFGAVGVWVSFTDGTVVAHNYVYDMPYTGISVGWRWDQAPTACRNNVVENNHVRDVLQKLCDGGCLYTLGFQPGTVIRNNLFHNALRSETAQGAPNNGIFFDQGSKGFHVEGNVIYATSAQPIRFNQCKREWHTWADNRFGLPVAAPGKVGAALSCDGMTSYIEVPHAPELDPVELTAEAWVKLDSHPEGGDTRRWVVNKNDDEWVDHNWGLVTDRTRVGAYLNIGGGRKNTFEAWSAEGKTSLNRWHHLAFSYDGADLRVYLDGRQVASTTVNRPRTPGSLPIAIGRRQDAYKYFQGLVDEVRLYNRALIPTEVEARFRSGGAPPAAALPVVGYWGFDDLDDALAVIERARAQAGLEPPYRERLTQPVGR